MSTRFHALGLRFNPFGALPPGEVALATVPRLPPPSRGECVQLVAHHGRGKSCCLRQWEALLPGAVYLRAGRDGWPDLSRCEVLLLDEAEQLRPGQLREAAERVPTLAFAAHWDLSPGLPRVVRTVALPRVDLAWVEQLVARRLAHARLGNSPVPEVPRGVLAQLVSRHGENLRALNDALYEWYQHGELPGSRG